MNFRTNKYYLLILLAAFIVGGCGNSSGNYEEIESSASSESTTTTDNTTTDSTTYNYFTGSTVTVNFLRSDNSLMGESGTWCNSLNDCNCGIGFSSSGGVVLSTMEFKSSISGDNPPFTVEWKFNNNSYTDNFSLSKSSGNHTIKLYVTDNNSNKVYAKCRSGDQGEVMMNLNIP